MDCLLFLVIVLQYSAAQVLNPIVTINDGSIQGILTTTRLPPYTDYNSFTGIPYAAPPIGALRFKSPQPVTPWSGILATTAYGAYCPQIFAGQILGLEDCLTLNVFTKKLPADGVDLKPVMFWIHGGAMIAGSGALHGPDFLIQSDVVIVTINYRLGVFGFLSTGDDAAYGNWALKDQVAALQWVQNNIINFNGDPNKVTVFGESAGALSTHLLQLSPLATGLFHQVMLMSGCAINPMGYQRNMPKYLGNLAAFFQISMNSSADAVTAFQAIPFEMLLEASLNNTITGLESPLLFSAFLPIVEVAHPGAFMTKYGLELLELGTYNHMPWMFGHTSGEGSVAIQIIQSSMDINQFDTDPLLYVSSSFNNPPNAAALGQTIKDYFLGNSSATDYSKFTQYFSDEYFRRGMRKAIDYLRTSDNGYYYIYSYEGTVSMGYPGVAHTEDLQYYWYLFYINYTLFNSLDLATITKSSKLWTNFAIYGNPTPAADPILDNVIWPPVTSTSVGYLDIGDTLTAGSNPDEANAAWWQNLFDTFGVQPLVTY